jgi:acetyltransferase-like isoleucine patch superfamily enzyme
MQAPLTRPVRIGPGARLGAHAAVSADVAPGAVVGSYTVAPLTSA